MSVIRAWASPAISYRISAHDLLLGIGSTVRGLRRRSASKLDLHRTRSSLTGIRASLRLLRHAIGDGAYRRCNAIVRDAGRQLDAARDAQVLVETVERLRSPNDGVAVKRAINLVRSALTRQRNALQPDMGAFHENIFALQVSIRDMAHLAESLPLCATPEESLICAYKRGRQSFSRARKRPTDANLHEWRKQMKYCFCETELIRHYAHRRVSRLHHQASLLAGYLGQDHDLAVLQTRMRDMQASSVRGQRRSQFMN